MQQLVDLLRLDAGDRSLFVDQTLLHHIYSNLDRRLRGTLAASRLQHV